MLYLRQSTASQSVLIGPFVDSGDGNSVEGGLTIANTDIRLSKNGANIAAKNSGGGTHDELGYYTITLDATDTDTVGRLQLLVHASGALAVYHEFQVLEEAVFDALYAASAVGPLLANSNGSGLTEAGGTGDHLTAINLPNQTMDITGNITGNLSGSVGSVTGAVGSVTGNVGGNVAGSVASVTGAVGSVTGHTAQTGDSFARIGALGAGLTALATAAALTTLDTVADAIKVTTDKLDDTLEDDAGTFRFTENSLEQAPSGTGASAASIADAVWTEIIADHSGTTGSTAEALAAASAGGGLDAAGVRTAIGLASANLDTQLAALPTAAENRAEIDSNSTQLAAIVEDTGTTLPATLAALATAAAVADLPTNAELATALGTADDAVLAAIAALNNFDPSSETVSLATGGITAAIFAAGAIDAAALSTDAAQEIRDSIAALVATELTGDPGASPTWLQALALLYMAVRNKRDTTATSDEIHNNAGTPILEAALSDDGTVFSKAKLAAP